MTNTKEEQFFDILKHIFVGVPVEGQSGYINLMGIKARYFGEVMEPRLRETIAAGLQPFPDFREELCDKLYTFFRRYFTESGSIGFFFTPYHQSIYEQVYTNEQDVVLFWKTARLYYVKTDRLFQSMTVEADGFRFHFDVSQLEHKRANEKRKLIYKFNVRQPDGTIVFTVHHSKKERQTGMDDLRCAIRNALHAAPEPEQPADAAPTEKTLQKAFRVFERQSEVDYFLCTNAGSFLCEQFDLWMWQYLLGKPGEEPQTEWTETRLAQLQALKRIAYRVIDYIAAFEDELVKIWNKPKFVLNSHYVITLDRIEAQPGGMEMLERLWAHPNMEAQLQEWRELGMVDEKFRKEQVWAQNLFDSKYLHPNYRYLPIDTRYFPDLELPIVSLFDNLDEALNGWLIKSENYQALNTILPRFRHKVNCIYIDPPYNTGMSEIDYINRFKDSSWLSMLENRLSVSKEFLTQDGLMCMTIDHVELHNARNLIGTVFGEDNVLGLVSIKNNPSGRSTVKGFSVSNEYAIFVGASEVCAIGTLPRTENQKAQYGLQDEKGLFQWRNFLRAGGANDFRAARPRLFYPLVISESGVRIPNLEWDAQNSSWIMKDSLVPEERLIYPVANGVEYTWRLSLETLKEKLSDVRVRRLSRGEDIIEIKFRPDSDGVLPKTVWDDKLYNATAYGTSLLREIMGKPQAFSFPKSVYAVADCIRVCTSDEGAHILDFFTGSGTTAHAVINLNREDGGRRKYILVEMADYFYTVLLPRIKKVVFSDKWKDGKAQPDGKGISHFVKYYELEQFEDTLRRARYAGNDLFTPSAAEDPCQYLFLRDLKMLEALEVNLEHGTVQVDLSKLYENIDLPETLSNLTGKWIRRIEPDPNDPHVPAAVVFADGERVELRSLDWRWIKSLIWW